MREDSRAAIGVDVGGTKTKGAIVSSSGEVLARVERLTDSRAATKGILAVVDDLLARASRSAVDVVGVGVGAAGFIDRATGSVTFSPNVTYDDAHLAEAVRVRSGLPVAVDNDANAAAWGERAFGAARGADNIAYLTVGTGIGSGFIVDGRLLRGLTGAGAELGHTVIDPDGPPCGCGLRGCLEQFASGQAIARMAREAVKGERNSPMITFAGTVEMITTADVARAAHGYDEIARAVLQRAGKALGIGLSNVANLFDPEVILLGGSVIMAGEPFLGPARDQLFEMTAAQRRRPMRLGVTSLKGDAGIVGAAALAFDAAGEDGPVGKGGRPTP